jgi:hypothetical protein
MHRPRRIEFLAAAVGRWLALRLHGLRLRAAGRFGSGCGWRVATPDGRASIRHAVLPNGSRTVTLPAAFNVSAVNATNALWTCG